MKKWRWEQNIQKGVAFAHKKFSKVTFNFNDLLDLTIRPYYLIPVLKMENVLRQKYQEQ